MAVETLMFKLEGVKQATEVSALVGKTFTVGKVTGVSNGLGNGLFKWLFLVPSGEAAGNTVALKIEGGRQAAQLAGLAGKTVTVGQAPTMVGGTANWLVLNSGSGAGAAAATGVAAKGATGSKMMLMQLEGTQQVAQMKTLAGKSFTVIPSPMVGGTAKGWLFMKPVGGAGIAGKDLVALQIQGGTQANLSGLIGKSFTVSQAPLATGNATGSWIVLKPMGGAAAKGVAAGAAVAAKGGGSCGCHAARGWLGRVGCRQGKSRHQSGRRSRYRHRRRQTGGNQGSGRRQRDDRGHRRRQKRHHLERHRLELGPRFGLGSLGPGAAGQPAGCGRLRNLSLLPQSAGTGSRWGDGGSGLIACRSGVCLWVWRVPVGLACACRSGVCL
ncbi:MAG: hypothetical protein H7836_03270 [Magnetococcus sp. YQC-3]